MQTPLHSIESVFEKVGKGLFHELTTEEELIFYREVLDKVRANIYIDQINDVDDHTQSRLVWMNKSCIDQTGYSNEEAYAMGYKFFQDVQPPDGEEVGANSFDFHRLRLGDYFHAVMRQFDKHKKIVWYHGYCLVLHEREGNPWQLLNVAINIQDEVHSQQQLLELQKENMQLKSRLLKTILSKREKQILCLIARGKTDREISCELSLSIETARTHRKNIFRKLGKNKTAEVAVFASENGFL
ncbi:MAG: LuxR C-terminal-related transcriptional regulator [Bacteroidetes bacterium]|nr:LuxR C-terminal-related transcriptional regulator [Bacteroidota bacterium]